MVQCILLGPANAKYLLKTCGSAGPQDKESLEGQGEDGLAEVDRLIEGGAWVVCENSVDVIDDVDKRTSLVRDVLDGLSGDNISHRIPRKVRRWGGFPDESKIRARHHQVEETEVPSVVPSVVKI